jgi:probable HAF family extracellular repeat protein
MDARFLCAKFLVILCTAFTASRAGVPEFQTFQAPFGSTNVTGVSADGSVVVGYGQMLQAPFPPNFDQAYVWRPDQGFTVYGIFTNWTRARAISADATRIVGGAEQSGPNPGVIWDITGGGGGASFTCPIAQNAMAYGVNSTGNVVVGQCSENQAFRRVQGSGITVLGDLPGAVFESLATGVSGDGSVVVGIGDGELSSGTGQAFRWTQETGMVGLGDLPGGQFNSQARAISTDGQVIVGMGSIASGPAAFRWEDGVMTSIGTLAPGLTTEAFALSADGSVIVGRSGTDAFIWDAIHGMRNLQDVLENEVGLDLGGVNLSSATGISADGTVIVGQSTIGGWRAVIPEPATASLIALLMLATRGRRTRRARSDRDQTAAQLAPLARQGKRS